MKAIIQRVTGASVSGNKVLLIIINRMVLIAVDGKIISSIGRGVCVLLGISRTDTEQEAEWMYV